MADEYSDSVDPTEARSTTFDEDAQRAGAQVFDDDGNGEAVKVKAAKSTDETRTQARMNAHHIQKFVNQQGAPRRPVAGPPACERSARADRSSCSRSFWRGDGG